MVLLKYEYTLTKLGVLPTILVKLFLFDPTTAEFSLFGLSEKEDSTKKKKKINYIKLTRSKKITRSTKSF
jgi:hypothetical protein